MQFTGRLRIWGLNAAPLCFFNEIYLQVTVSQWVGCTGNTCIWFCFRGSPFLQCLTSCRCVVKFLGHL